MSHENLKKLKDITKNLLTDVLNKKVYSVAITDRDHKNRTVFGYFFNSKLKAEFEFDACYKIKRTEEGEEILLTKLIIYFSNEMFDLFERNVRVERVEKMITLEIEAANLEDSYDDNLNGGDNLW